MQNGVGAGTDWMTASAAVPGGTTVTLELAIFDSGDGSIDSLVLIDDFQWLGGEPNEPPTAIAGSDQIVYTCTTCIVPVALDGSGSSDPEDPAVGARWTNGRTVAADTLSPIVTLPTGTHTLTLTITDVRSATASDTVIIDVRDVLTLAGSTGPAGPAGPQGPQGPPGVDASAPPGSIVLLEVGAAAPAGYTFIGTTQLKVRAPGSKGATDTTFNLYRKN